LAEDPADTEAVWMTEVWESQAADKAALEPPQAKAAIAKGRALSPALNSA